MASLIQVTTALLAASTGLAGDFTDSEGNELETFLPEPTVSAPVSSATPPVDPQVSNFIADIEVSYDWDTYDYDPTGPKNTTGFNLTDAGNCGTFYTDILLDLKPYRYFNACIAMSNFTYDLEDGKEFSENVTENVIQKYNISAESTYHRQLARKSSYILGQFMSLMCDYLSCAKDISDPKEDPCNLNNIFVNNGVNLDLVNSKYEFADESKPRPIVKYESSIKCQAQICKRAVDLTTDDPDIGGVGVFLSYAFQLLIAILLVLGCAVEWFRHCIFKIPKERRHDSYFRSKPFVNVCVNFHKTQVFFVMALTTAAFIKNREPNGIAIVDQFLLMIITLNGLALLSFTLIPVYMISHRSLYNYSMSFAAFLLCLVFAILGLRSRDANLEKRYIAYNFCQDWYRTWNFDGGGSDKKSDALESFLIKAALPKPILILIMVWTSLVMLVTLAHQFKGHKQIPQNARSVWRSSRRTLNALSGLVVLAAYGCIIGLNVYLLTRFWKVIDHQKWGFGQVVAVMVWIPVLADFVNDQYHMIRDDLASKKVQDLNDPPHFPPYEDPGPIIRENSYYKNPAMSRTEALDGEQGIEMQRTNVLVEDPYHSHGKPEITPIISRS